MKMTPEFTTRFSRQLVRKHKHSPRLAAAVMRTVDLVMNDPQNRGLNAHLLDRQQRIWEAYVTKATRITYQLREDGVLFRANCRHDIIDRGQW